MISKGIIEKFFDAAFIQRWNDHVRPVELTELDKQAHKMLIAYILAKFEETERKQTINWTDLIQGAMFEFLHRVILTDIKPSVFHQIMKKKGNELNQWVFQKLQPDTIDLKNNFFNNLKKYFSESNSQKLEKKILQAAHYLATNWEFNLLYPHSSFMYSIENTKEEIENEIEQHYDLIGVQKLFLKKKTYRFVNFCGQLRFQQRWAHSPHLPKTSVLGHMLIVAMMSYLFAIEIESTNKRIFNTFFGGLFHDLPEILTRDIISPIKSSVEGLKDIIKEYEDILLEDKIMPLLPYSWHKEIKSFINMKDFNNSEIQKNFNKSEFLPVDAEILIACDHLAAFIEASLSYRHGITSRHLEDARRSIYKDYQKKELAGINIQQIYDYFKVD